MSLLSRAVCKQWLGVLQAIYFQRELQDQREYRLDCWEGGVGLEEVVGEMIVTASPILKFQDCFIC